MTDMFSYSVTVFQNGVSMVKSRLGFAVSKSDPLPQSSDDDAESVLPPQHSPIEFEDEQKSLTPNEIDIQKSLLPQSNPLPNYTSQTDTKMEECTTNVTMSPQCATRGRSRSRSRSDLKKDLSDSEPDSIQSKSSLSTCLYSLNTIDHHYSGKIHKWEFGRCDIIVLIPGLAFGVFGYPFFAVWYWWHFGSPLVPLLSTIATCIVTQGFKKLWKRPRPKFVDLGSKMFNLHKIHTCNAMPSGDVAHAAVIAMVLLWHYPLYWPLCLLCIPAGAFGRIYFGAHWIGDCIVGALMGIAVSIPINIYFIHHL